MTSRTRGDLCPGVLRPWPAEDGALVRLRLIGGEVLPRSLAALMEVATAFGNGTVHLTRRANLQLRALPSSDGCLDADVVAAIAATGLLPVPSHELVRNVLVSPLTGLDAPQPCRLLSPGDSERHVNAGRVDLRPMAAALDEGLCADPVYAGLSARFLFVLDDGRGDVIDRRGDLGLIALDASRCQVRVGDEWGPVVAVDDAVPLLLDLARAFVAARGTGPEAPWHVNELSDLLHPVVPADPATRVRSEPPAYGVLATGIEHVPVPDGLLDASLLAQLLERHPARLVVTPWRSVIACT
ncbi:nitrite reductase [Nocardioides sp. AE5]|uniref:nitrite reductase n=1 Tax=Nocardioides sp. AE5 TaxID=2962573 RepID=UPI0028817B81|nr:nitrite reductase [Nocardioides sp. AE5]MDT0202190.1 nitrite reductase [Nocardioides sp. AE5]